MTINKKRLIVIEKNVPTTAYAESGRNYINAIWLMRPRMATHCLWYWSTTSYSQVTLYSVMYLILITCMRATHSATFDYLHIHVPHRLKFQSIRFLQITEGAMPTYRPGYYRGNRGMVNVQYSDVTWTSLLLKSPATPLFVLLFIQAHI